MKASEFAKIFGINLVREDKYSFAEGYTRYKAWRFKGSDGYTSSFLVRSFDLDGILKGALYDMVSEYLAASYRMLGISERAVADREKYVYELLERYKEAHDILKKNKAFKKLPVTEITEIFLNKSHLEDDLTQPGNYGNYGLSPRVVAEKWVDSHDVKWLKQLLKEMKIGDELQLISYLKGIIENDYPDIATISDALAAEKLLGANRIAKRSATHLKSLAKSAENNDKFLAVNPAKNIKAAGKKRKAA